MERFKAVEKEMKTKAYSKEGLSAAAKLDPKEKAKMEACEFLCNMVEELERQIETLEAEMEALQATVKKGKKDTGKSDRVAEIDRFTERHKWHTGKLELILRALENGDVEPEQVTELEENIKDYVENNQEPDFVEDDTLYDDLNLAEEEDLYGMNNDLDHMSSQDAQSIQEDGQDEQIRVPTLGTAKQKPPSTADAAAAGVRRPSAPIKSPLPALATLHTTTPSVPSGIAASTMKPAPPPVRTAGEPLKYASAAAAAAASDKNGVGIAPLPPPPSAAAPSAPSASALAPSPSSTAPKPSATTSPSLQSSQPVSAAHTPAQRPAVPVSSSMDGSASNAVSAKSPAPSHSSIAAASTVASSVPPTPALEKAERTTSQAPRTSTADVSSRLADSSRAALPDSTPQSEAQVNGESLVAQEEEEESIYHLPASLQDLIESFEAVKSRAATGSRQLDQLHLEQSYATQPDAMDALRRPHYRTQNPYPHTPAHYPQEPLPIFDDPRLYSRVDTDTLFYAFYYCQGTYQQYLAAKALKAQSWRFHKQYQTWFQRHEEPKKITDEFEQGTYRFFDYESTWLEALFPENPLALLKSLA